jgi:hypothetical protein
MSSVDLAQFVIVTRQWRKYEENGQNGTTWSVRTRYRRNFEAWTSIESPLFFFSVLTVNYQRFIRGAVIDDFFRCLWNFGPCTYPFPYLRTYALRNGCHVAALASKVRYTTRRSFVDTSSTVKANCSPTTHRISSRCNSS